MMFMNPITIAKDKCLLLIKHFDEECKHWYDHSHYLRLKGIEPELAEHYKDSMFTIEVYVKSDPIEVKIRCNPYNRSKGLFLCNNLFSKTLAYINERIEKKKLNVMDITFLEIFDLPTND